MRLLRPIKKSMNKAVDILSKQFGLTSDVYRPVKPVSTVHGYRDDDIEYEEEPYIRDKKILIPHVFNESQHFMSELDSLFDSDDIVAYVRNDDDISEFSKIVVKDSRYSASYRVDSVIEVGDDENIYLRKLKLVPVLTVDVDTEEFDHEMILEEVEADEIRIDDSISGMVPDSSKKPDGFKINPL